MSGHPRIGTPGDGRDSRETWIAASPGEGEHWSAARPSEGARPLLREGVREAAASDGPPLGRTPPSGERERSSLRGTPAAASLGEGEH